MRVKAYLVTAFVAPSCHVRGECDYYLKKPVELDLISTDEHVLAPIVFLQSWPFVSSATYVDLNFLPCTSSNARGRLDEALVMDITSRRNDRTQ